MLRYKHLLGMGDDNPYTDNPKTAQKGIKLPTLPAASQDVAATANLANLYYDSTGNAVMAQISGVWTALSTSAAVGSLDQVCTVGATTNEVSVTFSGSAASVTAFAVGGAAANDKVVIYHDATNAHINTLAGDLHLEPVGGDVTITGNMAASGAVQGATVVSTGAATLASCSVTGALTAGSFALDALAAFTPGASLKVDGSAAGGVNLCSISTGGITMSDDATVVAGKTLTCAGAVHSDVLLVSLGDIALADGRVSITDNDNAASFVITNDTFTNGASGLVDINAAGIITGQIISVVADNMTTGSMFYLESSAAAMNGKYIQCFDGAADDFSVGLYGATIIAGNAAGTAALTVSAGDLKLTAGVIDQDIVTDHANVFTRNQGTTTVDFVQILCTAASDDHAALYVKHDGTAGVPAMELLSAGTDDALKVTVSDVAGTAIQCISGAGTDSLMKLNGTTGHWVGANGVGMLAVNSDGTPAHVAASLVNLTLSGNGILVGEGNCLRIVDTSAAATSHSVYISSTSNEALWVDVGKSRFDEGILVGSGATGYVSSLGAQDLVLRTNEGTNSGTITIADGAAGAISIAVDTTGRVSFPGPARADGTAFTAIPQLIGMPFVAGSFDGSDDLTLSASMPKGIILDYWVQLVTEEAITLILRDAAAGAGNVKAAAIDLTAAGPRIGRTAAINAPAMAATSDLFVHASGNPAAAVGTVYVMYVEVA